MKQPIRIQLIDDRALITGCMRSLLLNLPDVELLKSVDTTNQCGTNQCGRVCMRGHPDVLIIGVTFHGKCGLGCVQSIMARNPKANILVVSMQENEISPQHCIKAGAKGYLTMNASPEVLIRAVYQVAEGRSFIEPDVAQRMMTNPKASRNNPFDELTRREYEVLLLLLDGLSATDISNTLHLCNRTVANYHTKILQKLGISNNIELTKCAILHRIINL